MSYDWAKTFLYRGRYPDRLLEPLESGTRNITDNIVVEAVVILYKHIPTDREKKTKKNRGKKKMKKIHARPPYSNARGSIISFVFSRKKKNSPYWSRVFFICFFFFFLDPKRSCRGRPRDYTGRLPSPPLPPSFRPYRHGVATTRPRSLCYYSRDKRARPAGIETIKRRRL